MDTANHPNAKKRKKTNQSPESKFQFELNSCSKNKDLSGAITLYESAISQKIRLNQQHFNALLYLCSNSVTDPSLKDLSLDYGFRVFDHLLALGINPNEASVTAVARLAAAKGDGDYAFELVKSMGKYKAAPRLRTFDPALFCFCDQLEADKAYHVEEEMGAAEVTLEEAELAALLKVSAKRGRADRVYEYLHKLRRSVRCVSESTAQIIEDWFQSIEASGIGDLSLDAGIVKEGIVRNGGGWHGQGWIGKGSWAVRKTNVDADGRCYCCRDQLACVDIDDDETEKFAQSVAALAMEREVKANFSEFQGWLEKHADFEAIVDGANVGLYQQNFADGGFSISQLDDVVKELYNRSKMKPLVILHNKRMRGLMENPSSRKLVEEWRDNGILYTTPNGSNDDWYWLYAAVKLRCFLVTNDEMRDHIFELIGSSFFKQWKERHQVHYTFVKGNLKLLMPPSYSLVIQESEKGSWHVPVLVGNTNKESSRIWLCITRPSANEAVGNVSNGAKTCENRNLSCHSNSADHPCRSERSSSNGVQNSDFSQGAEDNTAALTGKRKERSPSS